MSTSYPGDPHQYQRYLKGKNYYCSCCATEDRSDGHYKCDFHKREYDLKKEIKGGTIHRCHFVKEQSNPTIDAYFSPKPAVDEEDITYEGLLTKVAIFVGRRNLSLEAGASSELQDLIKMAIEFGAKYSKGKSKFDVNSVFKKYTTYMVRNYMIAASHDVNKIQLSMFSKLAFVGVSIDEGTTRGIHDLDFVLENPLSNLEPYPCFTSVMLNGTATQYTEHLSRGLEYLRISKIPVGSLTVDGNTAQLKALSFKWSKSLRRRYIDHDDFVKRMIVNPCLCHKINNAYKRACRNCPELCKIVKSLRLLSEDCREHPDDIKGVCPRVQLQRWIVDFDICSFILDHAEQISEFTFVNINGFKKLYRLLTILKSLVNIFEDPRTPHFKAFRIIENAVWVLEELEEEINYAQNVKEEIQNYCQNSDVSGIWMLLYILTPEGRADFCKRISKKKVSKTSTRQQCDVHSEKAKRKRRYRAINRCINRFCEHSSRTRRLLKRISKFFAS